MLQLNSLRVESKRYPGVCFILRLITVKSRMELDLALAEVNGEYRDTWHRLETLRERSKAEEGPDLLREIMAVSEQIARIDLHKRNPAVVRWGLLSIEDLAVECVPIDSAQTLIDSGPEGLFYEILEAINDHAGLTPKAVENLESPTTSGAAVGGANGPETAPSAESMDTTQPATAPDISLAR